MGTPDRRVTSIEAEFGLSVAHGDTAQRRWPVSPRHDRLRALHAIGLLHITGQERMGQPINAIPWGLGWAARLGGRNLTRELSPSEA